MTPQQATELSNPPSQWSEGRRARYTEVLKGELQGGVPLEQAADRALRECQLRHDPAPPHPPEIDGWAPALCSQWNAAATELLLSGLPLNSRTLALAVRIVEDRLADRVMRSGVI